MAPTARFGEPRHLPGRVINNAPAIAILDLKSAGSDHIEGDHLIVGVATDSLGNRHSGATAYIEGLSHVVNVFHFNHDVMQAMTYIRESDGVMSPVGAVEKDRGYFSIAVLKVNIVADAEAQDFSVELFRRLTLRHAKDGVAERDKS